MENHFELLARRVGAACTFSSPVALIVFTGPRTLNDGEAVCLGKYTQGGRLLATRISSAVVCVYTLNAHIYWCPQVPHSAVCGCPPPHLSQPPTGMGTECKIAHYSGRLTDLCL